MALVIKIAMGGGIGFGGAELAATGAGGGYSVGDPITAGNLSDALQRLSELDPSDPDYQSILDSMAVAMASGDLSEADEASLLAAARGEGLTYNEDNIGWDELLGYPDASHLPPSQPIIDAYNQAVADGEVAYGEWDGEYLSMLSPNELASLYRGLSADSAFDARSFFNAMLAGPVLGVFESLLGSLPSNEIGPALNNVDIGGTTFLNLSGLNVTGWDTTGRYLWGINFSGSNVTAAQLNGASIIRDANLSGTGITRADLEASGNWSASMLNTITF